MSKDLHRLSSIILRSMLVITISGLVVTSGLEFAFSYRTQRDTVSSNQQLITEKVSNEVARYVNDKIRIIHSAIAFSDHIFEDEQFLDNFSYTLLAMDPSFRNVVFLDPEDTVLTFFSRLSTGSFFRFLETLKEKDDFGISPVYIDPETNEPLLAFSVPWDSVVKGYMGRVVVEINLKFMWDVIESINIGESGETYVINAEGRIIASRDSGRVIRNENIQDNPIVSQFRQRNEIDESSIYRKKNGMLVIGKIKILPELGWAVITELPLTEAYQGIIQNAFISLGVIVLVIISIVIISRSVSLKVSAPIIQLTDAASHIAEGKLNLEIPVKGSFETAKLTEAFNVMTHKLKEKISALDAEIEIRLKTEYELNQAKKYIANIINSMPSQIIGVDTRGDVTLWNNAAENATGISSDKAIGMNIEQLIPSIREYYRIILEAISTKKEQGVIKRHEYLNGNDYFTDMIIFPLAADEIQGAVIRIDDTTEKVKLEEFIIQSEKMMSVGGMAAGMAHEINNPLAGIMQNSENLRNRLYAKLYMKPNLKAADELGLSIDLLKAFMEKRDIPRILSSIRDSGIRVSKIVRNMLTFSKKDRETEDLSDPTEILDNCVELSSIDYDLKKSYDFKKIEIRREYEDSLPRIHCNRSEIQQVFMNILRNGAEAMFNSPNHRSSRFTLRSHYLESEDMVQLEIEDNGPGMDPEVKKRIFEPFFSTKGQTKGTGLGLSVSFFIITESHNGKIFVDSQSGKGTKFTIQLPVKPHTFEVDQQGDRDESRRNDKPEE